MKKLLKTLGCFALMILAYATGVAGEVFMANATDLPDAGRTVGGAGNDTADGIATETAGRQYGDPNFYLSDVDERIVKIRPMATPLDQMSRYAKSSHSDSFEVKYYSVGTREIKCVTSAETSALTSGDRQSLQINDANIFTLDDTIRVVGVKGGDGNDLVLCVCGKDSNGKPQVYAVNGTNDLGGQPIGFNAIPEGTTLIRMGKACGELDVQTGRFNNIPMPETQYCQNFMIQVEQSTFDKIARKEANWDFSDLEEDGIYDMRLAMENTFWFGAKGKISHAAKDGAYTWFTEGLWNMVPTEYEIGHDGVISDNDLVDLAKDLFVGTGVGNKRKVLFCGSELLAAFSKIQSDKFRLKDTVKIWDLQFKSWVTDFGEILTMHHETFDLNGLSDQGFALDPEYLSKKVHVSWGRNVLDLQKAGVRNTNAVVIQEVACLYLRYIKAHARVKLRTEA